MAAATAPSTGSNITCQAEDTNNNIKKLSIAPKSSTLKYPSLDIIQKNSQPIQLQLYNNNFTCCSHCNLPPLKHKKLLSCSNCASAAYHNSACQRSHWKVHKRCCKILSKSLAPLKELICWNDKFVIENWKLFPQYHHPRDGGAKNKKESSSHRFCCCCWWHPNHHPTNSITIQTIQETNHIWNVAVEQWNAKEYLRAMEGMQFALEVYQNAWKCSVGVVGKEISLDHMIMSSDDDDVVMERNKVEDDNFVESSMILAKRLLFLAYCEMDGGQIASARQRLVQCISITNTILYYYSSSSFTTTTHQPHITNNHNQSSAKSTLLLLLNDAYMELMLSMEEIESDKVLARHVANMAIANGNCCGWVDPMQRPGYMASNTIQLSSVPIIDSFNEQRPMWCTELERNYETILEEYWNTTTGMMAKNQWMDVGCGRRGSGHEDHSVVEGRGWKEYVLFGTGALDCEDDAPFTKKLLRQHVPDAVTLAQEGGGEVIFSRLSPRTHIKPHCGPTNLRWTAHLGLVIPKSESDCRIRVGHEWVSWSAGKILLFDDSFEHEVRNDTDEERVVLLIRLWHPELMSRSGLASQLVQEAIAKKEESIQKRYNPPS